MGSRFATSAAVAALLLLVAAMAGAELPPRLPVEAFGRLPVMAGVEVSPGGRNVAASVVDQSGKYGVVVFDLEQIGKKPPLKASSGDWDINWLHWKTDDRLLISGRYGQFDGRIGMAQRRLIAVNADGSNLKWLVTPRPVTGGLEANELVWTADRVVDFLPDDSRKILMAFNPGDASGPRLYRVDTLTDAREQVEPSRPWISRWLLDRQGRVRLAQGYTGYGSFDAHLKTYYRADAAAEWTEVWDEESHEVSFQPLVFDASDPDVVVAISEHEGRFGLYRFRLSSREFIETLFLDPAVDIEQVLLDPRGRDVQGVRYVTDVPRHQWFSPGIAAVYRDIQEQLPGWSIDIVSRSFDDQRMIVLASAADHAGRYFLYEAAGKHLRLFSNTYPELDQYDLARATAVRIKASDGLEIPAVVTLPRGAGNPPARPLPAVLLLNDGLARARQLAFDPLAQMLANRGYAVLQVNLRGAAGFGTAFRKAGDRQWGEAVQGDVTDATRWLVGAKIADPGRLCVVGSGLGGHAALMGAIKEPGLYRCVATLNSITDLPDYLGTAGRYAWDRRWFADRIGRYWSDADRLAENSPARRAKDLKAAVLLVHADEDAIVSRDQGKAMAAALQDAKRDFRYVRLKDEDHWLSHGQTRLQYYQELDAFLAGQLR